MSSDPEKDIRAFLDALIYNWIIVNPDAHSKNYSLFLAPAGIRLAPLYDICSIIPYRNQIEETPIAKIPLAMKVGDDYRVRKTDRPSAWSKLAADLGLPDEEVMSRMEAISAQVPEAAAQAASTLPSEARASRFVAGFLAGVVKRARKCGSLPSRDNSPAARR